MSLLLAAAIVAVPFILASETSVATRRAGQLYEVARAEARSFLVRNPELDVDAAGALILEPEWLEEMRASAKIANANRQTRVELPSSMMARSQARLDGFIAEAHMLRKQTDPAWKHGVQGAQTQPPNYFMHSFIPENAAGLALSVAVMLIVGIALELTWGSFIFAAFTMAVIPATAMGYRFLDASTGIPWSGGAGLAGALMGAYFIRGLGGQFTIPGWLLLPAWLGVESFVVRGFWIDDLSAVPWATLCASVGFGALVAGALRMARLDAMIVSRSNDHGPNPIVARTARLRSDGDPYQAFDLIQAAWRDDPASEEIADAFFSIAVEVGQPEAAAAAIIPNLSQALRKGDMARAIDYWLPLATNEADVDIDVTSAVKLGEALLDASHPREAIFTLEEALKLDVSANHAVRIVKIARDLDASLAQRAAKIALADASLDAKTQAELRQISADDAACSVPVPSDPAPEPIDPIESNSQLDRRVQAEHQAIETTAFPIEADEDFGSSEASAIVDASGPGLEAQSLDPNALSAESLSVESSGDVLSHWTDGDDLASTAVMDRGREVAERSADEPLLDASSLECHDNDFGFGSTDIGEDLFADVLETDADTDRTPLMDAGLDASLDATGEMTSPLLADAVATEAASSGADSTSDVFDQPTMFFDTPKQAADLRPLKALEAIPVSMGADWIEIDASPRGKSKLPFVRIESLSMAAVEGLGDRPVLVIDCVLSQSDHNDGTMKSIRFRSDRFDPLAFSPNSSSPLAALTDWVSQLQAGSNATCLPSRTFLAGEFTRFASIEIYDREVLSAIREEDA